MSRHAIRIEGGRAVLAARVARDAHTEPDTTELERLAEAAGYDPVGSVTQRRREDPGTWLGRGKAETLTERAAETDADAVLVDGGLTPGQYANLLDRLPAGTELVDRYRLVLGIFAAGSADRRAALQVEAATLRYELPRLRQATEESLLNEATEKGSPVLDAERRVDRIETKLAALADEAAERREERRAAGLGLVALAGYTNAGKTTLLHRLADGMSVEEAGGTAGHDDAPDSTPVADDLFVTLETTTRRGSLGGRPAVFTDTVGLLDGVPHDLVESFGTTLSAVSGADVPVLVVDASDPVDRVREKVRVSLDALDVADPVVALNKVDALEPGALDARRDVVADLLDGGEGVPVSARDGTGVDRLRRAVAARLPTDRATFRLPNAPETESFLAWVRERGACEVTYEGEWVAAEFVARPAVVAEARGRAPTE
ncbi:50S ribosome-binding GTPase [Salinirubellus salinus]|uniref:50S ribosome-binding GTPase n=1 Tax=Salinirubellus salinus TaxID=1364945 RepID=A0A9E7R1G7_9EURY|nr:GTPase [Salinirubellus salinus]UWM53990.1 50S ribosome-binding GTPase [Salinirubellus salinus]